MDGNAYRDDGDPGQPDAYWRRRVVTLCAGLVLLGLLAWIFSGGGKPAGAARKGASAGSAASLPFPSAATPSARSGSPA